MINKRVRVRVIPGAKKESISKMADGRLKVKVNPIAERGQANLRAVELLAKYYCLDKDRIRIVAGGKSNEKIIKIFNK